VPGSSLNGTGEQRYQAELDRLGGRIESLERTLTKLVSLRDEEREKVIRLTDCWSDLARMDSQLSLLRDALAKPRSVTRKLDAAENLRQPNGARR
jgi:hypothetical protein